MSTKTKNRILESLLETPEVSSEFVLELDVSEFCSVNTLFKLLETTNKSTKNALQNLVWGKWVEELWNRRKNPGSLLLKSSLNESEDCSCLMVVPQVFDVFGQKETPSEELLLKKLESVSKARELVKKEVRFVPEVNLSFQKLDKGNLKKVMDFLVGGAELLLSPDLAGAYNKALITKMTVEVKEEFYDRVCEYSKDVRELKLILDVFNPRVQFRSAKFGLSDSAEARRERLIQKAHSILTEE